mmetsp:Transcript_11591/g.27373  ORF Transcript_11591/g.27373 Transcript_11591/m.27373 type:complete len:130 (+) Transcript_11591:78-467(+)
MDARKLANKYIRRAQFARYVGEEHLPPFIHSSIQPSVFLGRLPGVVGSFIAFDMAGGIVSFFSQIGRPHIEIIGHKMCRPQDTAPKETVRCISHYIWHPVVILPIVKTTIARHLPPATHVSLQTHVMPP